MRFESNFLARAVFGTMGIALVVATPTFAQTSPERLERIEVTGSNIKRVDQETVAPVEIITREDIVRSGRPNIAEVLRNIPANNGQRSEQFTNSFAPGAAGISLRGLGQKTTLVLINGRRVSGYGFAQNISDTFVDLNAIPTAAVERVEILKDGASAIYGSDAIAGVVNIILRKDYQGIDANIGYGRFEGKNEYSAQLTGGYGNLGTDKFNIFATLDLYKRDLLQQSETHFTHTRDMRGQLGGRNFQSLTGAGTWRQVTGTAAAPVLTNNYRAISECATPVTGPQAVALGLINLSSAPANQSAATLATNTAMAAATNTFCAHDYADQFTALPETERIGFIARGTLQISPTTQAYLEAGVSRNETKQKFQAPFFAGTTGLQQTPAGLRPFTYNVTFAPGVAGNPFPTTARYVGVHQDLGTRDIRLVSETYRGLAGLTYSLGTWDLDSAVGYSRNDVDQSNINRTTLAGTSAAFGVSTAPQPPVPISTASTYNLDRPSTNSAAVRDSLLITFPRKSTSKLEFADTKASTELAQVRLPGGPLAVAVGAELRHESIDDRPDSNAIVGNILGQGITKTDGARTNYAGYLEFAVPVFKQLEAQLAYRFDHYSDFGTAKTPKLGLKFSPNEVIAFRGNWGKGFRAPTLPEISPSVATSFTTIIDPEDGVTRQISSVFAGNAKLQPETSVSSTAGVIIEPTRNFSVSIDVYKIRWRNVVAAENRQTVANASCPRGGPGCPSTPQVVRDPATNTIVTILTNYINLAEVRTSGVDVDLRYTFPTTEYGKFTTRLNSTYLHTYTEGTTECAGHNGCTNTQPRVKAAASLDYDYGPLSLTGRVNYIHSYYQDLLPATYFSDTNDPRFQNGAFRQRLSAYYSYDVFGRYSLTKNVTLSASVVNLFNKMPPYDPAYGTTLFDYTEYDVRGRQFRINLGYKM